jgi:sugar-phosphatase
MHEFRCRAILFDLDGVLVDSTACIERHWTRWATQHGLDPALVIRAAHGRPTVETMREVAPHLAAEEETARLEAAEASDTGGVMAFSGAAELLRSLPEGSWAVATSGTRRTATNRLANRAAYPKGARYRRRYTPGKATPGALSTCSKRAWISR